MVALFHGRRFYLTRAIAPQQRERVRAIIEANGGEVTSDLRGSIQLVSQEHLSPETEWVAIEFVLDSVERGALQDLSNYMGAELEPAQAGGAARDQPAQAQAQHVGGRRGKRIKYTKEDDARMLRFLQSRQLNKSMVSVPISIWAEAARRKVTLHSSQSMNERYRKQLRTKTAAERRAIIAEGLAQAQARTEETNDPIEDADDGENPPSTASNSADNSGDDAADNGEQETPPTRSEPAVVPSPHQSPEESKDEEAVVPETQEGRIKKRLRRSTVQQAAASPGLPAVRQRRHSSPVRASELPTSGREPARRQSTGATQRLSAPRSNDQHSPKQVTSPIGAGRKRGRVNEAEGVDDGDEHDDETKQEAGADGERGVYFTSFWAKTLEDSSARRRLHNLFEPSLEAQSSEPATPSQGRPAGQEQALDSSAASTPQTMRKNALSDSSREDEATEGTRQLPSMTFSSEQEMDLQIARIQFETRMDLPTVVHALYYASGDYTKAKAFLKGQSPAGIWSAEDDALLGSLISEETTRGEIEEAIQNGVLSSLRVPHSVDEVLVRIQYLL